MSSKDLADDIAKRLTAATGVPHKVHEPPPAQCPNCELTLTDVERRDRVCCMCGWSQAHDDPDANDDPDD